MANIPNNQGRQRQNLINVQGTPNINNTSNGRTQVNNNKLVKNNVNTSTSADDDFFDDFNTTIVDDLDNSHKKKIKAEEEHRQKQVENKQKLNKRLLITGVVTASVLIVGVAGIMGLKVMKQSNYTLNTIPSGVIVEQQAKFKDTKSQYLIVDNNNKINNDNENGNSANSASNYDIIKDGEILGVGKSAIINTVVNTKTASEKEYSLHDTQFYLTCSNITYGYDNVLNIINEFNETSNNKIKLPDAEAYYSSGTDIAIVEFTINYPSSYPTLNDDGKIYNIPTMSMEIEGYCQDILTERKAELELDYSRYIVVDENVYKLQDLIPINTELKSANIETDYVYRFIIPQIPVNAKAESYGLKLNFTLDDKTQQFTVSTVDINETDAYKEYKEKIETENTPTEENQTTEVSTGNN